MSTTLTQMKLGRHFRGLGLSPEVRANVARACKRLSTLNPPGTINTSFSPYCVGSAPTIDTLQRIVNDENDARRRMLTSREINSCRIFLKAREDAKPAPATTNRWAVRRHPQRPPLHSFGSMSSALPTPSRGNGFFR